MNRSIQSADQKPAQYRRVRPVVDVFESDAAYQVHVELPGVVKDDVELTLEQDFVRLQATRKAYLSEPIVYDRVFSLPETVDRDQVTAQLEAGVLHLTLPKRASVQPRQIEVKAA